MSQVRYDDVDRLATQNGLTNQWAPPTNPNRFIDGGFNYDLGGEIAWGHGPDIIAKPHQYVHNNPTMSINRPAAPNTLGRVKPDFYHADETWSPPELAHLVSWWMLWRAWVRSGGRGSAAVRVCPAMLMVMVR